VSELALADRKAAGPFAYNAETLVVLDNQVITGLLEYPQIRLVFSSISANGALYRMAISLSSGSSHCRPLRLVSSTD